MSSSPREPGAPPRRPRGRPPVPLDRIVAEAVAIVDEQGADALTMRTLAQRLNSGTATLYRHFTSRSQLIAHVVDAVLGQIAIDSAGLSEMPWRQACEVAARRMFEVFRAHPNVARLLVEQIPMGPSAMARRELMIALLLDAGFAPPLAAKAYATLARFVLGFAIQIDAPPSPGETNRPEAWPAPDPRQFPATTSVREHLPVPLSQEFTFGLQLLLDALTRRIEHS